MKLLWPWVLRPLTPHETDWEVLAVTVGLLAGFCGLLWMALDLVLPGCTFLAWTGLPCVTCGGTRALHAMLGGNALQALAWNPAVALALLGSAGFFFYSIAMVVCGSRRLRLLPRGWPANCFRVAVIGGFAFNWAYVILRENGN